MPDQKVRVLLIEDDPGDRDLLLEQFAEEKPSSFEIECADRLMTGLACLIRDPPDVVLLDLLLPDSQGLDTFTKLHAQAANIPVVVLTGVDDDTLAVKAVQAGAQDYLFKDRTHTDALIRSLRYAIERHRLEAELRSLAFVDELTGLYNRRGFLTLAEHQLKIARRMKEGLLLLFADLDNLKRINDTSGHAVGDRALAETAQLFKKTFRNSDLVARLGGDEFAVLAIVDDRITPEVLMARWQDALRDYNASTNRVYELSVSIGTVRCLTGALCPIEQLLGQADQLMYQQKNARGLSSIK